MKSMTLSTFMGVCALSACAADETLSAYSRHNAEYRLVEVNGEAYANRASISFGDDGRVSGQAPCNRYFGQLTVPYPWFGLEGVGATRMACDALAAETEYFTWIEAMTLAEISDETLILSNSSGDEMVFSAN